MTEDNFGLKRAQVGSKKSFGACVELVMGVAIFVVGFVVFTDLGVARGRTVATE